jgi:hypothetical protein
LKKIWGPILAVALLPMVLTSADVPAAAAGVTTFAMDAFAASIVDPVTGRVFVSGDDRIEVFTASGAPETTITDLGEPTGMAISGEFLYVLERATDKVLVLDLDSFATTAAWPVGAPVDDTIVVMAGAAWVPARPDDGLASLHRVDLTTGAVLDLGAEGLGRIESIPGATDELLSYDPGTSDSRIDRITISEAVATVDASARTDLGSLISDVVATTTGSVVPSDAGDPFLELDTTSLALTGVWRDLYDWGYLPTNGIAFSEGAGGTLAGTGGAFGADLHSALWVFAPGDPVPSHTISLDGRALDRSVQLAPDGSRAYVVERVAPGSLLLSTHDLAPSLADIDPGVVVAGVPTRLDLTGVGLSAATTITVDGSSHPFNRSGLEGVDLEVTAPAGMSSIEVEVNTPFGSVTDTVPVSPNTGGSIVGRVRDGGVGVGGAEVLLTGPGVPAGSSTTTASNGSYSFNGLPMGDDRVVQVTTTGGAAATSSLVDVRPNQPATVDIDLTSPIPGNVLRRTYFDRRWVRDVLVETTTGRVFVSADNTVEVFTIGGRHLSSVEDLPTAHGLTQRDGFVYVSLSHKAEVVEIDASTMQVTSRFPIGEPLSGTITTAGGRIWLIGSHSTSISTPLISLDPDTGDVTSTPCSSCSGTHLTSVDGEPDSFLTIQSGIIAVGRWDAATSPPTLLSQQTRGQGVAPFAASASVDRLWTANGDERVLSTLVPTGTTYPAPTTGDIAHSPSTAPHADVIALAGSVYVGGSPIRTHELSGFSNSGINNQHNGLNAAGDHLVVTHGGTLWAYDLAPRLLGTTPDHVYTPGPTTFSGQGIGRVSDLVLDGDSSIDFTVISPTQLVVDLGELPLGPHTMAVTTPFGTSAPLTFDVVEPPPPVITDVEPQRVSTTRVTSVAISGLAFIHVLDVKVGGSSVPFTVNDTRSITIEVPSLPSGDRTDSVEVTTSHGVGTKSSSLQRREPSTFTSVEPDGGAGTQVRLTGTHLDRLTSVTMNGQPVPFDAPSPTSARAYLPEHAPGSVTLAGATALDPVAPISYDYPDVPAEGSWPGYTQSTSVGGSYTPLGGDFNGDGVDDVFWYAPGSPADSMWRFDRAGHHSSIAMTVSGVYRPMVGDFTGDGTDDIFWYAPGTAADSLWDFNPGGSRTTRSINVSGSYTPFTGDFTGDGADDVFLYAPGGGSDVVWDFNPGFTRTDRHHEVTPTYRPVAGDFDGNGVDDIIWHAPGPAQDQLWRMSNGGGIAVTAVTINGTYSPIAADFQGDGADDVLWYSPGSGADSLWAFYPGGYHESRPTPIPGSPRVVAGDFNGGGVTDLLLHGPGTAADSLWFLSKHIP